MISLQNGENVNKDTLIEEALKARENAYTPYSHFKVGAALLTKQGKVYHGCNIENAAYSPTNCAERTAFFKAVSQGERDFCAIAIVGFKENKSLKKGEFCAPCGVCRQVMREFCNPKEFLLYLSDGNTIKTYTLEQLLPLDFGPDNLK